MKKTEKDQLIKKLLGPITDATGRVIPAEHFENDFPCLCESCQARRHAVGDHTYDNCV